MGRLDSVAAALWEISRYFTISTNLIVGFVFTGIAIGRGRFATPRIVAGVALSIMLVGIVYAALLRGLIHPGPLDAIANLLLHGATPILVPLYWLAFVRKGELRTADALAWAVYPLAYLAYALVRSVSEGRSAYPFLDIATLGWTSPVVTVLVIAGGFVATGLALVRLDGALAMRAAKP